VNLIAQPELPLDKNSQLLAWEESGIIAIDKAAGVLSHPNPNGKRNSRNLLLADYISEEECYEWMDPKGQTHRFYLCHRLDSPTSGIIIGSSDSETATLIKEKFANREVRKTYHAVTRFNPKAKEGHWVDRLIEKRVDGKLRVERGNGPTCKANVRFLRKKKGENHLQLIELRPSTGRTHQLRVQCMLRKIPIVGDKTYGDFSLNRKVKRESKLDRLCLHASNIEFSIRKKGQEINFTCESPLPRLIGKVFT